MATSKHNGATDSISCCTQFFHFTTTPNKSFSDSVIKEQQHARLLIIAAFHRDLRINAF
jgi:hypothetical protein